MSPQTAPPPAITLQVQLNLELRLTQAGAAPSWQARVAGGQPLQQLNFDSMGALIGYLARLDLQPPAPGGIR